MPRIVPKSHRRSSSSLPKPSLPEKAERGIVTPLELAAYPGFRVCARECTEHGLVIRLLPASDPICPHCGRRAKTHDTRRRLVRDVALYNHPDVWVEVPVRRVRCTCGCHHKTERIDWLIPNGKFTYQFMAAVQSSLRDQDVSTLKVANEFKVGWDTVRRWDEEQLREFFSSLDPGNLQYMAIDEIAIHKEHKYVTIFLNLLEMKVFAVVEGKSQSAIEPILKKLVDSGAASSLIAVACDMNAAYPRIIRKHMPKVDIVYDQFHVIKKLTEDVLRPARQKQASIAEEKYGKHSKDARDKRRVLRQAEWLLVTPSRELSLGQTERLNELRENNKLMGTLLPLAEMIRRVWNAWDYREACDTLESAASLLMQVRKEYDLPCCEKFADMLHRRKDGILTAYRHRISSGPLEGVNTRAKLIKRIGYGYRNLEIFALKLKAAFPGARGNPLGMLRSWTAVQGGMPYHTKLDQESSCAIRFKAAA